MDKFISFLYLVGLAVCFYHFYCKHQKKAKGMFYTAEVDATLERVQQLRQQIRELDQLQNEIDISRLDNCHARSVSFDWGQGHKYVFELCEDSESCDHLEMIIRKERKRLTTSLRAELSKIPHTGEVKRKVKTISSMRGEESYR